MKAGPAAHHRAFCRHACAARAAWQQRRQRRLEGLDGAQPPRGPPPLHIRSSPLRSLDYPGVGPEHSFLQEIGRAEYHAVTGERLVPALSLPRCLCCRRVF